MKDVEESVETERKKRMLLQVAGSRRVIKVALCM